jgi:hypothetical protein
VLERLGGEPVARRGRERDAGHPVLVELLGGVAHVVERLGLAQPRLVEEVLAVDQQLAPAVARHAGGLAVHGDEIQRLLGEGVRPEAVDDLLGRRGVEDLLADVRVRVGDRRGEHDVGQLAGGRRVGDQGGQLVLRHRHLLDLDAGLLGEVVEDGLGGLQAVGLELVVPDGDRLALLAAALAAAALVVPAATRYEREGGDRARDRVPLGHVLPPHGCKSS